MLHQSERVERPYPKQRYCRTCGFSLPSSVAVSSGQCARQQHHVVHYTNGAGECIALSVV